VSLGVVAALCVPGVLAKNQAAPAQQGEMGMRDKLQSAVESLNLTDDQKPKVKDIFADSKAKRQIVWSDSSLTDDQKKAKMKELHAGTMAKLNEVLTPDQQAQLKTRTEGAKAAKPTAQP
jgi:Spy/CpxP family protein refolding chaperone